jgi:hypothetical protein
MLRSTDLLQRFIRRQDHRAHIGRKHDYAAVTWSRRRESIEQGDDGRDDGVPAQRLAGTSRG